MAVVVVSALKEGGEDKSDLIKMPLENKEARMRRAGEDKAA